MSISVADYWDTYYPSLDENAPDELLGKGFSWTQWDHHGPDEGYLRQPDNALELGCGFGAHAAYLASKGVPTIGVDVSPVQHGRACRMWDHVPGLRFELADVRDYLAGTDETYDAVYSVWAAMWFTNPAELVPLVRARLNPGGVLAFSQAPAVEGCYGAQGMHVNGFKGKQGGITRWNYTPEMWVGILRNYGFLDVDAAVLEAPDPDDVGTLLVRASIPAS
ncbi:class I SAM-dependent methyltransferase [Yinghuangia soli]|uniref:Class I SAM-dependent methyltransferase n=1 Tax=Yinghuangia soli TaxID=2908204 RepID=A0AA41PVL9_9ACTN|nr:class I SAM-dependent methyltransferase [Yinghuangia soli]MCF2526511.1 class I SAM-dependent methyltransferase [Yinghuangia soli]